MNIKTTSGGILIALTILQSGCLKSDLNRKDGLSSVEYINLKVQFRSNTNDEMRNIAIASIKEILSDYVKSLRTYSGDPATLGGITVSKNLLNYRFTVTLKTNDDGISKPPCTCKVQCGPCLTMAKKLSDETSNDYTSSKYISSVTLGDE